MSFLSIALEVVKPLFEPATDLVIEHCRYALLYKYYVRMLQDKVGKLHDIRDAIQHQVDAASRNAEDIEPLVTHWRNEANEAIRKAEEILKDDDQLHRRETESPGWMIPDVITRYSIASRADKLKEDIGKLCDPSNTTFPIFSNRSLPMSLFFPSCDDYMPFESRKPILEGITKALSDGNAGHVMIGVWGMDGLGKTTLVQEVYRQATEQKFSNITDVGMVTVTQKVDVKKIQEDLGAMLGLKFNTGDVDRQRAGLLRKRLNNSQALIILDDLWEAVNLGDIGIPRGKGISLLLTSTSQVVLTEMGLSFQQTFHLGTLLEREAHTMFERIVGARPERKSISEELVKKCNGFPISIKALATTLRGSGLPEWQDALEKQKLYSINDDYSNLELIYKNLKGDDLKSLFLTCALFSVGNSIPTRDLIAYSMGLGIFEGITKVKRARFRLQSLVRSLQASSLVLDDNVVDGGYIKMHDAVHRTTIKIAAKEGCALVAKRCSELEDYPTRKLSECIAISLLVVRIDSIPLKMTTMNFPKLKIFVLIAKGESDDLPPKYAELLFQGMKELNVLHLAQISFSTTSNLLSSIRGLYNLKTLCLDFCLGINKEDIAIIGRLRRLQVLSFMGSTIAHLTIEIGRLSDLRLLDLSGCSELRTIDPGVLTSLVHLEELYMESCFVNWEIDGRVDEPRNAKLEELNKLSKLSTLDILVRDTAMLPKDLSMITQLDKFRILIGDCWNWSSNQKETRTLKLKAVSRGILLKKWVQAALDRTEDLHLDGLKGSLKKSIHQLSTGGFYGIKRLHVQNSPLIHYVVQSIQRRTNPQPKFEKLEMLSLENLENLEQICRGPPPKLPESFTELKLLRVKKCEKLKNLFCMSMVTLGLPKLEEIEISDCEVIKEIVQAGDGVEDGEKVEDHNDKEKGKVNSCNLRRLKLQSLPEFTAFCTKVGDQTSTRRSSSVITSDGDSATIASVLFDCQQVSFPQLESLELSGLGKLKKIWSCRHTMEFGHLKSLQVVGCGSLSLCLPSGVLTSLKMLDSLTIESCNSMQHVFDMEGLESTSEKEEILPQLKKLTLVTLPNLECILKNSTKAGLLLIIFAKLTSVRVRECHKLLNVFSPTTARYLGNVKKLRIKDCREVKAIVDTADKALDLHVLKLLKLKKLPLLATFVRGTHQIDYPQLQKIIIRECQKMKAFSSTDPQNNATEFPVCFFGPKVSLPGLEALLLESMDNLEKIWSDDEEESFSTLLRTLRITRCKTLSSKLVPPTLIKKLQNLEDVSVVECESVEVLFDCGSIGTTLVLPQLQHLTVEGAVKLKYIFNDNSISLGVPSLKEVRLSKCINLVHLFSNAMARSLSKLEHIDIKECGSMQEVVSKEDSQHQVLVSISFPHLQTLELSTLGSLKCFSSGSCEFDFPSLETLRIYECSSLTTFIQRSASDYDDDPSKSITATSDSLFDGKAEFPNLDTINLCDVGMKKVWNDDEQLPWDSFSKLKSLEIGECKNLETIAPSNMLEGRLQNLEKLAIEDCDVLKEIFQMEAATGGIISFENLKRARIRDCPALKVVPETISRKFI